MTRAPGRRTSRISAEPVRRRTSRRRSRSSPARRPSGPSQLIFSSTPRRSASGASDEHEQLAGEQQRERPARAAGSKFQQTTTPETTSRRSTTGSSSAPRRLYWPVTRAAMPSSVVAPADRRRRATAASASVPSLALQRRATRNTGISASRTKPIALGIVHGLSGAPRSVCRRRRARSGRGRTAAGSVSSAFCHAVRPALTAARARARRPPPPPSSGTRRRPPPAADLRLDLAGLQRALADRQPQRAAEQLGVGELLARARRRGRRRGRRRPSAAQLVVELLGAARAPSLPALPSATSSTSNGASARGHEMPCSSANCSTAAAAIRAGPMP